MKAKRKILFFVTEDWYFFSHRLPLAEILIDYGFEVVLLTRVHKHRLLLEERGVKVISINLKREGRNFFREIRNILGIIKVYRREKPDLVHHVAVKPVLYGSVAAVITDIPACVNAFAGLGFIFQRERKLKTILLQWIFISAYKCIFLFGTTHAIFQNPEDRNLFDDLGIINKNRSILIRGSGVDTAHYKFCTEPEGVVTILIGARMLWDKGIGELIQAVKILRKKKLVFRMLLAGIPDPGNPNSICEATLKKWHDQGVIEWIGFQEDMAGLLSMSHIAVLPSYREGVPKFLIEAASCGRPIVATDVPGCREIVKHNKNGLLVPVKDSYALSEALLKLIEDPALRREMGQFGREMAVRFFSDKMVAEQTMGFYKRIWND